MGFLDNSGDIILDAVLTDVGRRKLASGDFNIAKFAVGDDEIDYRLFDAQHASGSAYYDLEILQSPILEAGTKNVSSINYGLMSYSRNDILYLPEIVFNEKSGTTYISRHQGIFIFSHDNGLNSILSANLIPYIAMNEVTDRKNYIHIETGLNTTELERTLSNRTSYLVNNSLVDKSFKVVYDSRFFAGILGPKSSDVGKKVTSSGAGSSYTVNFPTDLSLNSSVADSIAVDEIFREAEIYSLDNEIINNASDELDLEWSQISGPRSSMALLNFAPNSRLNYDLYGRVGASLYGIAGQTFKYIDTIVIIYGTETGVTIQVPVRIMERD